MADGWTVAGKVRGGGGVNMHYAFRKASLWLKTVRLFVHSRCTERRLMDASSPFGVSLLWDSTWGQRSCFHSVFIKKWAFSFWEHTHTSSNMSLLPHFFRFLPSASMHPYLDTNEHAPICCAGISQSGPLSLAIRALITEMLGSELFLSGKRRRKKVRNK